VTVALTPCRGIGRKQTQSRPQPVVVGVTHGVIGPQAAFAQKLADLEVCHLKVEPVVGFEPTTDGLQNRCSTTELNWHRKHFCASKNFWQEFKPRRAPESRPPCRGQFFCRREQSSPARRQVADAPNRRRRKQNNT